MLVILSLILIALDLIRLDQIALSLIPLGLIALGLIEVETNGIERKFTGRRQISVSTMTHQSPFRYSVVPILLAIGVYAEDSLATGDGLQVTIHYIHENVERRSTLSSLVVYHDDEGIAGARLGLKDNNTTGKFLAHEYRLQINDFESADEAVAGARTLLAGGPRLVLLNVSENALKKIAELPDARDDLLFNTNIKSNFLRSQGCQDNVLHTIPSRAMLSDALIQFLAKRKWTNLFLIEGLRPGDSQFAESVRISAKKFGAKIKHYKKWLKDAAIRRNAALEVPVFTQKNKYDAIVVADEDQDFSQYLLYNTWLPRPVTGSAGLRPVAWSQVMEQWGALQLQTRFNDLASRPMTSLDYSHWAAIRSIGEAVTRTQTADPQQLRNYMLSEAFSLAGFKGKKMSYRPWNGQLRQPIPLVQARALVAMAPIEGYLHLLTELDTLGLDKNESKCKSYLKK